MFTSIIDVNITMGLLCIGYNIVDLRLVENYQTQLVRPTWFAERRWQPARREHNTDVCNVSKKDQEINRGNSSHCMD